MDQKLSDLVNKVDREARQFASFDDYLSSKSEDAKCEKAAENVVENSSPTTSEKAAGTVASSSNSSVAPVIVNNPQPDPRRGAMARSNYIADGHKTPPVHPIAEVVVPPTDLPPSQVLEAQIVETRYSIQSVEWDKDRIAFASEETKARRIGDDPDWWRDVYLGGQEYARALDTGERIVDALNMYQERIEKLQRAIQGMRSVLEDKLKDESAENRKRLSEKSANWRASRNQEAAQRMKAERKPSPKVEKPKINTAAIKLADTMAGMNQKLRGESLLAALKGMNVDIDDSVVQHVARKWGR